MSNLFNSLEGNYPFCFDTSISGSSEHEVKQHLIQDQSTTFSSCCDISQVNRKKCSTVALQCIDFRLRDNMSCQLNSIGLQNDYNAASTPGVSLAYNGNLPGYTGFDKYFDNIVKVSYLLHNIHSIILVEHGNCGAYTVAYGNISPEQERAKQLDNVNIAANTLWKKFNPTNGTIQKIPNLTITGYRISINGCDMPEIYSKTY